MSARSNAVEQMERIGCTALTLDKGLEVFDQILLELPPQVAVMLVDRPAAFMKAAGDRLPAIFEDWAQTASWKSRTASSLRQTLNAAAAPERLSKLVAHIQHRTRDVLRLDPRQELDPHRPLVEFGMDSLLAVELRNVFSTDFEESLPAALLFDYPTVHALTGFCAQEIMRWDADDELPSKSPNVESQLADYLAALDNVTDQEARQALQNSKRSRSNG